MELGTFGAILRFAMDLEEQAEQLYRDVATCDVEDVFRELARGSRKRVKRLERARRELVAEMILESITGLDGDAYRVDLGSQASETAFLQRVQRLELVSARFYRDAAAKMPILEVARLFQRMASENDQRRARLSQ